MSAVLNVPSSQSASSPTPSSTVWCTTRIASSSRERACARRPPSVRSLTPSRSNELMTMPTREQGPRGGRDHRNPWPASIGMGGRLRSESPADFVGMRNHGPRLVFLFAMLHQEPIDGILHRHRRGAVVDPERLFGDDPFDAFPGFHQREMRISTQLYELALGAMHEIESLG